MDYTVKVTKADDHVRVVVQGEPTLDQLLALFNVVGMQSGAWKQELMLLDLRGVSARYPKEDEYRVGKELVANLAHLKKIASVVPPDRITRLSERAARRMDVQVRVFDAQETALAWLRET